MTTFRIPVLIMAFLLVVSACGADELTNARQLLLSRYLADREEGMALLLSLGPDHADGLLAMLQDPNPRISHSAAVALAKLGEKRAIPILHRTIQSKADSAAVIAALQVLPMFGADGFSQDLHPLLMHSDPAVVTAVLDCFTEFSAHPQVLPVLRNWIRSLIHLEKMDSRILGERLAVAVGAPSVPLLMELLQETTPVCHSAAVALAQIGEPAIEPLAVLVRSGRQEPLILRAAMALFAIDSERVRALAIEMLEGSANPFVRERAADSLARVARPDDMPVLVRAANDGDEAVRAAALRAMASLEKLPEGFPRSLVISRLGDPAPSVRLAAVALSGRLALVHAVPMIPQLVEDSDPEVVSNALWIAGELGDTSLIPLLQAFLGSDRAAQRIPAAKSLLQLGNDSGEKLLRAALADPDIRHYALWGLSFTRSTESISAVVSVLPLLNEEQEELARYSLFKATGALLELSQWPVWWALYGRFWVPAYRDGVEAYFRSRLYAEAQIPHLAAEYLTQAASIAPAFPPVSLEYARYLVATGDRQSLLKAVETLEKRAQLLPEAEGFLELARAYTALGRTGDALAAVSKGIALGDGPVRELLELRDRLAGESPR